MKRTRWTWVAPALVLALSFRVVGGRATAWSSGWQVLAAAARMPSFYDPSGMAVGPQGGIVVADTGNNRILRLTPGGRLLARWSVQLLPASELSLHIFQGGSAFKLPAASIAVDTAGNMYVVAPAVQGVRKYSPGGKLLTRWDVAAGAVAADRMGHVYVVVPDGVQKRAQDGRVLASWSHLSPDGKGPASIQGIAIAPNGDVYVDLAVEVVPDQSQCYRTCPNSVISYIQHLSPDGRVLNTWKWLGCSEFSGMCQGNPVPMAADARGSIFAADEDNNRIYRFSPAGHLLGQWGTFGPAARQLEGVLGLAVDARGRLLTSEAENGRIQGFTAAGQSVLQWGAGTGLGQFSCPGAVALTSDGTAYVQDLLNGRIEKLSPAGHAVAAWKLGRTLDPSHENACSVPPLNSVVSDTIGNVYAIAPLDGYHIYKFSPSGRPLATLNLGRFAAGSIAVGGRGNLLVSGRDMTANYGFHRLLKLSPSGKVLQAWPATPPANPSSFPVGAITVDRRGNVYIAEPSTSRIWKLSPSFHVLARWGGFASPLGIAVDPHGNVYIADNGENAAPGSTGKEAVWKLSPQGTRLEEWSVPGSQPGQFHEPAGVAVDPRGRWLYVADTGNNRVQRLEINP